MIPTLLTATSVFIIAFIAAPPVDIDGGGGAVVEGFGDGFQLGGCHFAGVIRVDGVVDEGICDGGGQLGLANNGRDRGGDRGGCGGDEIPGFDIHYVDPPAMVKGRLIEEGSGGAQNGRYFLLIAFV
ncbi:hypothetical protein NE237_009820 [Protea cynaroides]|uniref:Secreted protein n=1 Tax=Protea cynaroides TaxID=273540 RepID=A0A9Q0KYK7_9MAGN|nr:hypothetical protein NE237_009820 [Protea cynaroides]